jgi:NAD(P)-dependent dehydrogenase (short-subunit alcohol dehydrogenase family)
MGTLEGKAIAVTGAGRGIGFSHGSLLAAEGASVVINDVGQAPDGSAETPAEQAARQIREAGGTAVANTDDISTWDGGQSLVASTIAQFGRLDGLVLNAGIIRDRMIVNLTEPDWDAVMAVHLKGHFAPLRAAAQHWREVSKSQGAPAGGRVVMTSSEAGLYGNMGQANYSAAKAGIVGLSMVASRELARYGVTVNVICPRSRTPMTEHLGLFDATPGFDLWDPDNIAPWVAYLCTDEATAITGQTFVVHGGTVSLMEPWRETSSIVAHQKWTVSDLISAADELFAGRSTTVIPFPDPTASHG